MAAHRKNIEPKENNTIYTLSVKDWTYQSKCKHTDFIFDLKRKDIKLVIDVRDFVEMRGMSNLPFAQQNMKYINAEWLSDRFVRRDGNLIRYGLSEKSISQCEYEESFRKHLSEVIDTKLIDFIKKHGTTAFLVETENDEKNILAECIKKKGQFSEIIHL